MERNKDTRRQMLDTAKDKNISLVNISHREKDLITFLTEFRESPRCQRYLNFKPPFRFNVFYYDYMCTFCGSKDCRPKDDIKLTLSLIPPGRLFLLATTFCCRSNHGIPYDNVIEYELKKMVKIFNKKRVTLIAITIPGEIYSRKRGGVAMHFMIYVLEKRYPPQIID